MIVTAAGFSAAAAFAALAALHLYWAAGGRAGRSAAVPTVDRRPVLAPSTTATVAVAVLLAAAAVVVVGAVVGWDPRVGFRLGCAALAAVLLVRAIGDRRYVGFLKRVRGTEFARRDTWIYSPLCLLLALAVSAVALAR